MSSLPGFVPKCRCDSFQQFGFKPGIVEFAINVIVETVGADFQNHPLAGRTTE
jgi:hypothetical protein